MPTLALKNVFKFHIKAKLTKEQEAWLVNETAIGIITKISKIKLTKTGKENRLYFFKGRTGSGKSTLMISSLYSSVIKGTGTKLFCTEPRVVLTKANATDVIRYNPAYSFGKQIGILSGSERVMCSEKDCMYYCTTQILNDILLSIIQLNDKADIERKLSAIKIVVIDEVHVLDSPMMALLKTIKDTVDKFGDLQVCPLFIFASATISIKQMVRYYFPGNKLIYENPLMIGEVLGASNFPINEEFLNPKDIRQYNQEEKRDGRNSCYAIMAKHFYKNYYDRLELSSSYVKGPGGIDVQCRDVLFFVPLVMGIDTIGTLLSIFIKDCPYYKVGKGTTMKEVEDWRMRNRGRKRVLFIGFARGYSQASDELLSKPMENDIDALKNEIRIIAATPVIETGKTITTLYLCIDMGLTTTTVYNPLSFDANELVRYLKQIPINSNQMIQRLGRVGREAPGNYLHFYSKDIMNKFRTADVAETINTSCLSAMLSTHLKGFPLFTTFDLMNENPYLYPTTTDILIKTATDLINTGYLTIYGQLVNLKISFKYAESWILYARYLYYNLDYPLWDALLIAGINRKSLHSFFTVSNIDPKSLRYQLKDVVKIAPNDEIIEGIQLAKNLLVSIMYGKDDTFTFIESRIYGEIYKAEMKR